MEEYMAKAPHEAHIEMADAFDMADRNTPRNELGGANYKMGAGGLPRTPAQQASVKKAAAKSAAARGARAIAPAVPAKPGLPLGSMSLASKPKGGLLR
jgi:hypothetical protein